MAFNTIKLKKYSDVVIEKVAGGTITPGMILELQSAGTVRAHNTAGGNVVPVMVALEDELQGKGIDDNYTSTNPVQIWIPHAGDVFYGILADGETIVKGDLLESKGDGTLRKYTDASDDQPRCLVGVALEAVDTSDTATETERIQVMVA